MLYNSNDRRYYILICFFVALIFSLVLSNLQVDAYIDRVSYLAYAEDSLLVLGRNFSSGWLKLIFNEPLWLTINIILSTIFSVENVVRFIIFCSTFLTVYLVLSNVDKRFFVLALLFLLLPQVLKNNIIHLRQGLAVAIFLAGWFSLNYKTKYLCFIFSALIHSSFVIVLVGIIGVNILLYLRFSYGLRSIIFIIIGLCIAFFGLYFAELLGARQGASYQGKSSSASGLAFIYWSGFFVLFTLQSKQFLKSHAIPTFFILLYLSSYFFLPVTARVFESVLLIILLSTVDFKRLYLYLVSIYFIFYFLATWAPRIGEPGLGWFV